MDKALYFCALLGLSWSCQKKEIIQSFPEEFAGVGIELKSTDEHILVVAVMPDSPGAEAQIQTGDQVVSINGKSTEDQTLGDVIMLIRGKPGTQIELGVMRDGHRILTVMRRRVLKSKGR